MSIPYWHEEELDPELKEYCGTTPEEAWGSLGQAKATQRQVGGDHYKSCKIQPTEYILANELGWLEGNAVKYITRHKKKGGRESVLKAIHYLEMLLETEYPNEDS